MAERRMMAKSVIETDRFMDMPATAKVLYFYLMLAADDDGFVSNPKSIMRQINASEDDMKILLAKGYVLSFESGVIVIVHWKIHNYIQKDRYRRSTCKEKELVRINTDKEYEFIDSSNVSKVDTTCIQTVSKPDTTCIQSGYIGKDRLGKDRLGKGSSSNDDHDDGFASLVKFYESNFSTVSGFIAEQLGKLKDDYSTEWVQKAMESCVKGGRDKCNIRYLEGVLKGWKSDGIAKPWEKKQKKKSSMPTETVIIDGVNLTEGKWY